MSKSPKPNNRGVAHHQDAHPPNPPWTPLIPKTGSKAAISFYYSDPLSKTPIRDVSHKNDPKADPNLETMTFGLFSRCDRGMRATVVRQGIQLHFFCTTRRGPHGHIRVLTGYYRYGWFFKAPPIKKKHANTILEDYMLAAAQMRFVSPSFPLSDLTGYLYGFRLDKPFRTFRYVDEKTATLLLHLLNDTPDATNEYLSEICRVEQLVKERDKLLYKKKLTGFSWDAAAEVMGLKSEKSVNIRRRGDSIENEFRKEAGHSYKDLQT